MRRAIVTSLFFVAAVALVYATAYFGQRHGIKSSTRIEAAYMPLLQKQHDCLASGETECIRVTNEMMSSLLATRMRVLKEHALIHETVEEEVDNYLSWFEYGVEK